MLMESWSNASDGKGLLFSEELDFSIDEFGRSRKTLIEWDRESVDNTDFVDWNFSEVPRKALVSNNMTVGMLDAGEVGISSSKVVVTSPTCMFVPNSSLESGSNHSNSLNECNSQDSSLIDLKLGRLSDGKDAHNSYILKERSLLSSVSEPLQAKRSRTVSSRLQTPFCQVYGCNKDLSSSKEYHKRHKVCEVHSKTPVVIVNGIEQRFCQQCSRFHLLSEFDDGKRSCRKRLAGHNERRRKPQFGTFSARLQKSLNSYQGTKYFGIDMPRRSTSLCRTLLPAGALYPDSYAQYAQASLRHLLSAREDQTITSKVSTTQELAGFWHSTRALSLLSAESQALSHSARNIMARPLVNYGCTHHNVAISDQSLGAGSMERCITNGLYLSGMNSDRIEHTGSFIVSDTGRAADLQVKLDGLLQHSDFLSAKYCDSPEHGSTMDLLQLSSHLQRVDQQRKTMQVKQENEDFCSFLTTHGFERT